MDHGNRRRACWPPNYSRNIFLKISTVNFSLVKFFSFSHQQFCKNSHLIKLPMIGFWTRVFYFRKQPLPKKETSSFDFSEIFYVKWINFASNPCSNLSSSKVLTIENLFCIQNKVMAPGLTLLRFQLCIMSQVSEHLK